MSTGNDIVALALTDKDRTSRYRFYSRILSRSELPLYDPLACGGLSFHSFVWLLWSIKESVYKYVSRSNSRLIFSPLKIPVSRLSYRDNFYEGMIYYEQVVLYSRSFVTSETIMTVVSDEREFSHTRWGIHSIDDAGYASQSSGVRALALNSISKIFPGAAIRVVKAPDGPPVLRADDLLPDIPLSLAHHDHYVAYSYCLTANSSSYRKSAAN